MSRINSFKGRPKEKMSPKIITTAQTENRHHSQPTSSLINLLKSDEIFNKIHEIKPFSIVNKEIPIDQKLNQIFFLHKKEKSNLSSKILSLKKPNKIQELKDQCIRIISRNKRQKNIKCTNTKPPRLNKILKRSQESFEDAEDELAHQLISQTRKQKKVFQSTMNRLHKLIQYAEIDYVIKNDIDVSVKDIQKYGFKKLLNRDRVCTEYTDQYDERNLQKTKIDLNKRDISTWLRSSRKLVNITIVEQQLTKQKGKQKLSPLIKNSNEFLYKRYFKRSNQRKNILMSSSLQA